MTIENPYSAGASYFSLDTPALEVACVAGLELATKLENGDISALPDGVHGWLALHTQGINSPNVGETRGRIAEKLTPPYDSATAAHIGGLIRGVIDQGNRVAVKLSFTEIMASAVISDLYKKDQ